MVKLFKQLTNPAISGGFFFAASLIITFLEGEGNGGARGGGEEEYGEEGRRGGVDLIIKAVVKSDTVRNEIADYVDDLFLKVRFFKCMYVPGIS